MIAPYISIHIISIVTLFVLSVCDMKMPSNVVDIIHIVCVVLTGITSFIIANKWDNMLQKIEKLSYRIEQLEDSKESGTE